MNGIRRFVGTERWKMHGSREQEIGKSYEVQRQETEPMEVKRLRDKLYVKRLAPLTDFALVIICYSAED